MCCSTNDCADFCWSNFRCWNCDCGSDSLLQNRRCRSCCYADEWLDVKDRHFHGCIRGVSVVAVSKDRQTPRRCIPKEVSSQPRLLLVVVVVVNGLDIHYNCDRRTMNLESIWYLKSKGESDLWMSNGGIHCNSWRWRSTEFHQTLGSELFSIGSTFFSGNSTGTVGYTAVPSINFVGWKSLVSSHDTTDQAWYIYPSVYVYSVYPMMGFDRWELRESLHWIHIRDTNTS